MVYFIVINFTRTAQVIIKLFSILSLILIATVSAPLWAEEKVLATLPKEISPTQIVVSPDQSRFAWILRGQDSISVVVDGKQQKPYDWIVQNTVEFTADSKRVVYAARKRRKAMMVIEGNEGPLADSIEQWMLSPTGAHIAYVATVDGRRQVFFDDAGRGNYEYVKLHALAADGTLAYLVAKSNQQVAVINGKESKPYDLIREIRLSPDGKRWAYIASGDGQIRMMVDDQSGPSFDTLTAAQFSADGKHVAYLATRGNDSLCVLDGEAKTYPGKLSGLSLSTNGLRHLFISTRDAKDTLFIDGTAGPMHPSIATAHFSANGQQIAYVTQTSAGQSVFIDDQQVAHFDQILGFYPAPPGHSFAFAAMRNAKSLMLLDTRETPEYDAIPGRQPPVFLENGAMRFLAVKEGQIIQVTTNP